MTGKVCELLMADPEPAFTVGNSLASLADWADAVQHCGQALGDAGRDGRLALATRGVLARHILFHWNRMGFTQRQQAIWSRAAREAILGN
ncbi:lantibiotic dehydratase C-terminal domain-containing protein [Streptomyces graminilatus]|uniref:lantibiotic dehydratase C-terminal domain-containing protein n=1 Tax=Streptomyces graminilatus TaxID=1464070 RepID=UPI000A579A36|nr:lantibiotic dehydratase C-terminal domain-containing protein [Streptomyces graminilatus]